MPEPELSTPQPEPPSRLARLRPWIKWGLFGLVIWFVSQQARGM